MTAHQRAALSTEIADAVEEVLRRRQLEAASSAAERKPEPAVDPDEAMRLAHLAKAIYRSRRDRDTAFGAIDVRFGEPSWDIMLDLYCAHCTGKTVSVSSACYASAGPPTTGLRHLAALEGRGLIDREFDPFDRRRCFVRISATGLVMMDKWLSRLAHNEIMTAPSP